MLENIRKYDTQFKIKDNNKLQHLPIFSETIYYLVGFPRNSKDELIFILDKHTDTGYGDEYEGGFCFTGMFSLALTEDELRDNFEIIGSYEEKLKTIFLR